MKPTNFMLAFAMLLVCGGAQGESAAQGERPVRPESASNAAIGGWCDALTGAKKEECLRDERRRQDGKGKESQSKAGTCDAVIGLERERCLRQGGTLGANARPSAGASTDSAATSH
jgi:hypothetical protein